MEPVPLDLPGGVTDQSPQHRFERSPAHTQADCNPQGADPVVLSMAGNHLQLDGLRWGGQPQKCTRGPAGAACSTSLLHAELTARLKTAEGCAVRSPTAARRAAGPPAGRAGRCSPSPPTRPPSRWTLSRPSMGRSRRPAGRRRPTARSPPSCRPTSAGRGWAGWPCVTRTARPPRHSRSGARRRAMLWLVGPQAATVAPTLSRWRCWQTRAGPAWGAGLPPPGHCSRWEAGQECIRSVHGCLPAGDVLQLST